MIPIHTSMVPTVQHLFLPILIHIGIGMDGFILKMETLNIINKYYADVLPAEVWEIIEEYSKCSMRVSFMQKVQQHKELFQGALNYIEHIGWKMENKENGGFKLNRLRMLISKYAYEIEPLLEYKNTDCNLHVVDYINSCWWRMESTRDFSKKCMFLGRIRNMYMYGNFSLMKILIWNKMKNYGLLEACRAMENIIYNPSVVRDAGCNCDCDEEEREEDCDCECHIESESDDGDSDED